MCGCDKVGLYGTKTWGGGEGQIGQIAAQPPVCLPSFASLSVFLIVYLHFLTVYGIFQMPPGESSCPGGSDYVWQRGVEGVSG